MILSPRPQFLRSILGIPFFLFLISFIIRFLLISKGPYHLDCLILAQAAQGTFETGRPHLLFGPGYPLTVWLGAAFVGLTRLFGNTDPVWAVNLMSVVCSSASVPVLYGIGKRLFDERAGLFAALMFSVFPMFLGISVYGKSHTPCILMWLIAVLFAARYRDDVKRGDFLLSSVFLGLMGAARLQDMIFVFPAWLYWYLAGWTKKTINIKLMAAGLAIIGGITAVLHLWPIMANPDSYLYQFRQFLSGTSVSNYLGIDSPMIKNTLIIVIYCLTPVGLIISLLGWRRMLTSQTRTAVFLITWTVIPLIFYGNLYTTAPRFLVIAVPPLILAQGYFLSRMMSFKSRLYKILTLFTFSITIWLNLNYIVPILAFRHHNALLPDFGVAVGQATEPGAKIIAGDESHFIAHYGKREILPRPIGIFEFQPGEIKDFQGRLESILVTGTDVYITSTGLLSYDPGRAFSNMMRNNFILEPILFTTIEDWHQGELELRTGPEKLYKIRLNTRPH